MSTCPVRPLENRVTRITINFPRLALLDEFQSDLINPEFSFRWFVVKILDQLKKEYPEAPLLTVNKNCEDLSEIRVDYAYEAADQVEEEIWQSEDRGRFRQLLEDIFRVGAFWVRAP